MLVRAFSLQTVRSFAPALCRSVHSNSPARAPSAAVAAAADASQHPAAGLLQGLLGLSAGEAHAMLALEPAIAAIKPSVLMERVQFLAAGLGISSSRLRSLVVAKPQLLSDLPLREIRNIAGLST